VGRITLRGNRFLGIWSERGYNIYLYQSVVFAIVHLVRQKTYADIPAPLVRAALDACLILVLSTGLSYVTYPLERIVMKKMRLK
jgi:peptidoglycan/LPS O-acetylase OafA/YrhL